MRWLFTTAVGGLIGVSASTAGAQPLPAPPPGPAQPGSTSDELADMVMDVIEHGAPSIPTTTPMPAPEP